MRTFFKALLVASLKSSNAELLKALRRVGGKININHDTNTVWVSLTKPLNKKEDILPLLEKASSIAHYCRVRIYLLIKPNPREYREVIEFFNVKASQRVRDAGSLRFLLPAEVGSLHVRVIIGKELTVIDHVRYAVKLAETVRDSFLIPCGNRRGIEETLNLYAELINEIDTHLRGEKCHSAG